LEPLPFINCKRLYRNSKFNCRSHHTIDNSGHLWVEVIYPNEDELKYKEMFYHLNLHSSSTGEENFNLNPLDNNQFYSCLFNNQWHRSIIVDNQNDQNTITIRLLDLGIIKTIDRREACRSLRRVDDEFFDESKLPFKAIYCSVAVDDEDSQRGIYFNRKQSKLNLSNEAISKFNRLINRAPLFAKVVDFTSTKEDFCWHIILAKETNKGLVDVYMYLLLKFDKQRYDSLKELHAREQCFKRTNKESVKNEILNNTIVQPPPQPQSTITSLEQLINTNKVNQITKDDISLQSQSQSEMNQKSYFCYFCGNKSDNNGQCCLKENEKSFNNDDTNNDTSYCPFIDQDNNIMEEEEEEDLLGYSDDAFLVESVNDY
jgi:hypothetical protein